MELQGEHRVSFGWLVPAGLIYLALQNVCFLCGWVQPVAAALSLAGMFAALVYACRSGVGTCRCMPVTLRDVLYLLVAFLAAWGLIESTGMNAHTVQHPDYLVRNAVYETLVRQDWPVIGSDGHYFVYYMSYWLPPAALAKICPVSWLTPLLCLWSYLGLVLGLLLFFTRLRSRILLFFLLFLMMGLPTDWLTPLYHVDGEIHYTACMGEDGRALLAAVSRYCGYRWHILNPVTRQFCTTYNHAFPFFVFLGIYFSRGVRLSSVLLASVLLLSASPLAGIASLPLLAWALFRAWRVNRQRCVRDVAVISLLSTGLLIGIAVYLTSAETSSLRFLWQYQDGSLLTFTDAYHYAFQYLLLWGQFLLIFLLYRGRLRRNALLLVAGVTAVFISLCWVGMKDINELLFKGTMLMFLLPAYVAALAWPSMSLRRRVAIIGVSLLSSAVFVADLVQDIRSFSTDEEGMRANCRSEAGGTLEHPERKDDFYSRFWTAPPVDSLILKSGQTETPR